MTPDAVVRAGGPFSATVPLVRPAITPVVLRIGFRSRPAASVAGPVE